MFNPGKQEAFSGFNNADQPEALKEGAKQGGEECP